MLQSHTGVTAGKAMESCKTTPTRVKHRKEREFPMPYMGIGGRFPMVIRMLIRIGGVSTYDNLMELARLYKLRGFGFIIIRTTLTNNSAYLRTLHGSDWTSLRDSLRKKCKRKS